VLYGGDKKIGPLAIGGLVVCNVVATMVVGPVAGVFVDRWNHRRIMLNSEAIRFFMVGTVTAMTFFLSASALPRWVWITILYGAVFGVAVAEQFFNPARFATIGDIVPGEVDRARAFGLGSATAATSAILGPSLAAPVLITLGVQWALLLNTLSYAVSYLAIRSVRFPATEKTDAPPSSVRSEFRAGLKMFLGNRFLVALAIIGVFAQLGTGPINTLDIYFMHENLHTNPKLIGIMTTVMGCGALVGSLLAGWVVQKINARNTTWLGLVLTGILLFVEARQTTFIAALIVIFATFIPLTLLNTALSPQLLAVTPREYLGRMSAFLSPLIQVSSMLSIAISSVLVSTVLLNFHETVGGVHIGRIDTLYAAGGVIIISAGIYGYFRLPPSSLSAVPVEIPAQPTSLEPIEVETPVVEA